MWLLILTSLSYDRKLLLISLAIPTVISIPIIFDNSADKIAIFYLIAYGISAIVSASSIASEKRERLYTQLPVTRLQIAVTDLVCWLVWTGLFYGCSSLVYFAAESPVSAGYFINLLGTYLLVMGVMAFVGIGFVLANFRDRRWLVGYIVFAVLTIILQASGELRIITVNERFSLVIYGYSFYYTLFSLIVAIISLGTMYMLYMRQDNYLK